MNKRDSEALAACFAERGYSIQEKEQDADIILLNTCSVRDGAEHKAVGKMQMLIAQARLHKEKKIFGIMGCAAQVLGESLVHDLPGIHLVIGTHRYHRIPEYLEELLKDSSKVIVDCSGITEKPVSFQNHLLQRVSPKKNQASAFVNIMHGCNQYCTYCIVPYTRGHEFSRSIEEIVHECEALAKEGIKEIVLLGQIVTNFGKREISVSEDGKTPFVQLLDAIHEIEGIERIRFTAPHPKGYGDDLINSYKRLPKLCQSAHIPVQSGSNRILKEMHRGYTAEHFLEILSKLRNVQPSMGIATDIIVGFPGETDEEFQETLELVRKARFDNAFLFKYSPREGTPAAKMLDQVPMRVKEERHAELMRVVNELSTEIFRQMIGKTVEVLVEGPSRRNPNRLQGRSRCNKIVLFEGVEDWIGTIRRFRITRSGQYSLYGEEVKN